MSTALDLHALSIFVSIVEHKNISKAAHHLKLTQPAVSLALKKLETAVGLSLVNRNAKPIQITSNGEELYFRAKELLLMAQALKDDLSEDLNGRLSKLKLGLIDSVATTFGHHIVKSLRLKARKIMVQEGSALNLVDAVSCGRLDLAVTMITDTYIDNLDIVPIYSEDFVAAMFQLSVVSSNDVQFFPVALLP